MQRRDFLKLGAGLSIAGLSPQLALANNNLRSVVLIKLSGGNDGLNTLIPYQDPLYYQLRPTIAIPKHQVIPLEKNMGLNPYMKALMPWWKKGNLAFIQGIGYAQQELSHFSSIDVWETASMPKQYQTDGWLNRVLPRYKKGLHGVVLGDNTGPLTGKDCHTIAMQSPEVFLSQVSLIDDIKLSHTTPALQHLTKVQHQLFQSGQQLKQKMQHPRSLGVPFSTSKFGRRLESVAKMINQGLDATVYKVELDGFDTHVNQLNTQSNLLHHLAVGLNSFATAMQRSGKWNNIVVVTYSEFGRRTQENHGGGTDHGAASTHLVMGGRVRGGLQGRTPNLKQLDRHGNIPAQIDFRSLYGTLAQRWWHQANPWQHYPTLPIIS